MSGRVQNVIQTIPRKPHLHEDLACGNERSGPQGIEYCNAAKRRCRGIAEVPVQSANRKNDSAGNDPAARRSAAVAKKTKLSVMLVTRDDQLWPQVGGHLNQDMILKQVDTIDELIATTTAGQPAIVLLDARGQSDAPAALSRLQLHSPRLAVIALDDVGSSHTWTNAIALRQVIAHVAVPIQADKLSQALENAHEEVGARVALLGESGDATAAPASGAGSSGAKKIPWIPAAAILAVAAAGAAAYFVTHRDVPVAPTHAANPQPSGSPEES